MFYVPGWAPLVDVTRTILERVRQDDASNVDIKQLIAKLCSNKGIPEFSEMYFSGLVDDDLSMSLAAALCWDCLDSAPQVGVLTATGAIILAGEKVLEWYDPTLMNGWAVNLLDGYVGSAHWEDEHGVRTSAGVTDPEKYGPFLNCPLILPKAHVDAFMSSNFHSQVGSVARASLPELIGQLHRSKPNLTKKEIKEILCPGEKVLAFDAAYQEAAKQHPSLSRRGPKPRN